MRLKILPCEASPPESEPIFPLVPQEKKFVAEPFLANPWYEKWWVAGIVGAMIGGLIVVILSKEPFP